MKVVAAVLALVLVLGTTFARADGPTPDGPPDAWTRVRKMFEEGDYEGAKKELLRIYEVAPNGRVLFALGQAELNLGNYETAIDYYEKFIATEPGPEEVALAQQAIGAARLKLSEPKPPPEKPIEPPPPVEKPPEEKRWTLTHTGLVAFGGAALLVGGGLLLYSRSLGNDRSGTLSQYDERVDQARSTRWTGIGVVAAGTLLIGVTLAW